MRRLSAAQSSPGWEATVKGEVRATKRVRAAPATALLWQPQRLLLQVGLVQRLR